MPLAVAPRQIKSLWQAFIVIICVFAGSYILTVVKVPALSSEGCLPEGYKCSCKYKGKRVFLRVRGLAAACARLSRPFRRGTTAAFTDNCHPEKDSKRSRERRSREPRREKPRSDSERGFLAHPASRSINLWGNFPRQGPTRLL